VRISNHRKKNGISIVVPFYNESEGVQIFSNTIIELIDKIPNFSFEVICVDDGSSDDTLKQLISLTKHDKRFKVIELSRNFGKEAAITAGIDHSNGEAVILIDADLQDPPEVILKLIEKWQEGAEVVVARRSDRRSDSFVKRKTADIFYHFHNSLASIKLPANVGDSRLMDRVAVEALRKLHERQRFMKGLFAWIGFRVAVVDCIRNKRVAGRTKFTGWRLWNLALEGITSFSTLPLKIWTYIGAMGAILAFLYALFIIIRTLLAGVDVPGYA